MALFVYKCLIDIPREVKGKAFVYKQSHLPFSKRFSTYEQEQESPKPISYKIRDCLYKQQVTYGASFHFLQKTSEIFLRIFFLLWRFWFIWCLNCKKKDISWAVTHEKVPYGLSRCHTRPSFFWYDTDYLFIYFLTLTPLRKKN